MSLDSATEFVAVSNENQDSAPDETVENEVTDEGVEQETEEDSSESDDVETDEGDKDDYKKNASDRIRDLVERSKKAEEELKQLKERFDAEQAKKAQEQKPYYELDMEKLEEDIDKMYSEIDDLKLEGRTLEAAKIQRQIVKLLDAVEKNEAAKAEWEKKQQERDKEQDTQTKRLQEIEDAAAFYQKHYNIPDDVWTKSGEWLKVEFEKNPVLGKKFADMVDRQGAVASIEWAHQYVVEHMGKESKEAKAKKEDAKKKNIGGTTSSSVAGKSLSSFDDLMKLSSAEIAELEEKNPKLFNQLITSKLKSK